MTKIYIPLHRNWAMIVVEVLCARLLSVLVSRLEDPILFTEGKQCRKKDVSLMEITPDREIEGMRASLMKIILNGEIEGMRANG